MNDGVRRSLLAAKIARMQAEDEREAERNASQGMSTAARPGWGTATRVAHNEKPSHGDMPVGSSVLNMLIQRAASVDLQPQDGAGQA